MPSKYPCGSCSIGVKYSGIQCTSSCNMWYHAGCLNILATDLKKWTPNKIKTWKCTKCLSQNQNLEPNNPSNDSSTSLNNSIKEIEHSLLENDNLENSGNEDKLEMAAKIGNLLVQENKFLKCENENLHTKLASVEAKLEDMEQSEEKYLKKIEDLMQVITEKENQVDKEKALRSETENIFEEYDSKQSQLIAQHMDTINNLENTVSNLKKKLECQNISRLNTKSMESRETQTDTIPQDFTFPQNTKLLLTEIAELKTRLRCEEANINAVQSNLDAHKKVQPLSKSAPNEHKRRSSVKNGKKKNYFSVSLQVTKSKENLNSRSLNGKAKSCKNPSQIQKQTPGNQNKNETNIELLGRNGGDCQTPTQKQTPGIQDIKKTTIELIGRNGGDCQTPTQKQTPMIQDIKKTTIELLGRNGGDCQTPTQKQTPRNHEKIMTSTEPLGRNGGDCQTPTEKHTPRYEEPPGTFHTQILKEELKRAKSEIDSYKKAIELLQQDLNKLDNEFKEIKNNEKPTCTHCFPPLSSQNCWQTVKNTSSSANISQRKDDLNIFSPNPFSVLDRSNDTLSEQCSDIIKSSEQKNRAKQGHTSVRNKNKALLGPNTTAKISHPKGELLIVADSHGKLLRESVQRLTEKNVSAFIKSSADFYGVTQEVNKLSKDMTMNDHLLLIAGANSVERTSTKQLTNDMFTTINKLKNTNVIISSLPMRHDKPELDLKISQINTEIEKFVLNCDRVKLLPFHELPRHLFTTHGLHLNKRGKARLAMMINMLLVRSQSPSLDRSSNPSQPSPGTSTPLQPSNKGVVVIESEISDIFDKYKEDSSIALAHSISADFEDPKHMSAGIAVAFRKTFGRPRACDLVGANLTCQKIPKGPTIYSLVTKSRYFGKPTASDYDEAFNQLIQDFKSKGLKSLICSAIGYV